MPDCHQHVVLYQMPNASPTSQFISAPDGLQLHARIYGQRGQGALPVICLPGLTRTQADFEELATALSADNARRVIAVDYRGRGQSGYDSDPANYNIQVELADVLAVITALDAAPAVIVGTSRGGLIAMLMAAVRPTAIAAAVLNDIGPVIEPKGLIRIKGYVGKMPQPRSHAEAAEILRRLFDAQFPSLSPDDWLRNARRSFTDDNGAMVATYDRNLMRTLAAITPDTVLPAMWPQFTSLARVPVMLVRGALTDVLSPQTVETMRARHPSLVVHEVADQGHAPLLTDAATIAAIAAFVRRCESAGAHEI